MERRFCEEIADGELIFCTDSPWLPSKSVKEPGTGTGTVGYWIPEKDKENTFLGITSFHVLDGNTAQSGRDSKFSSYGSNCLNFLEETGQYMLIEENGAYTCTYVTGLYDNSLDVGVVRCTEQRRENEPDSEADKETFQWPRLLYEIVVEKEIKLGNILMDYETEHLKERKLSIFHNGRSSRNDSKVGVLNDEIPPVTLGVDDEGSTIIICDAVAIEPAAIVEEVPLDLELLKGIIEMYESQGEESESSSGSSGNERDCSHAESSSEVASGVEESPAVVKENDLFPCDDKHGDLSKNKGSSPNGSTTLPEGDIVNGAASVRDVHSNAKDITGIQSSNLDKNANKDEFDSGIEDDATQRFTHGGDSGCVYYLLIEKDGQRLKAPIGIHRGSCKDITNDGKRISYGSPIAMALKKIKELHGLDVWFPIVD